MKMKPITCLFVVILIISLATNAFTGDTKISRCDALNIANKEALALGYDLTKMVTSIAQHDTPSSRILSKNAIPPAFLDGPWFIREMRMKLDDKVFFVISYYPVSKVEMTTGGGLYIFIDAATGEILGKAQWK